MVLPRASDRAGQKAATANRNAGAKVRKLHAKKVIDYASDFSGMEAPLHALKKLGVKVNHIFASDSNKHCKNLILQSSAPRFFYDDVAKRKPQDMQACDFFMFGAPCQPFSVSGKGLGTQDLGQAV